MKYIGSVDRLLELGFIDKPDFFIYKKGKNYAKISKTSNYISIFVNSEYEDDANDVFYKLADIEDLFE